MTPEDVRIETAEKTLNMITIQLQNFKKYRLHIYAVEALKNARALNSTLQRIEQSAAGQPEPRTGQ